MPSTRFLLRMLVIASALAVAAFASSSPAANGQPGTAPDPAFSTVLQPDLTLHSTLSFPLLQESMKLEKTSVGFCQCGCGIRCTTSADCGGAPCRPFITCCDKTGEIQWNEGIGLSSRRSEMPALNPDCK